MSQANDPAGYVNEMAYGVGADAETGVGAQFLKRVEAELAAGHEDVVARSVRSAPSK